MIPIGMTHFVENRRGIPDRFEIKIRGSDIATLNIQKSTDLDFSNMRDKREALSAQTAFGHGGESLPVSLSVSMALFGWLW